MRLVVDTGGVAHMLSRTAAGPLHRVVDEYRGPIEPGVQRGGTIADAMIDLGGGWVIREPRLAVAEQVQLAVLHADGIVVPQLLADSDEAVVLDPRGRRMFSVDQATATLLGRTDTDYGSLTDAPIPACAIHAPAISSAAAATASPR